MTRKKADDSAWRWRLDEKTAKRLYVGEGRSISDIARMKRMDAKKVKELLLSYGIEIRGKRKWPVRSVDHYEELQFGETMTGIPLTRTVAILECGHKQRVWHKRGTPHLTEYRDKMGCATCGAMDEKGATDGGAEDDESQRPDDGRGGDPGAGEGADRAGQP